MKIGALYLFDNCLAAWHWSWSITWRWVLQYQRWHGERLGFYWMPHHGRAGGLSCGFNTRLGGIHFQSQLNCERKQEIPLTTKQFYKDMETLHKLVEQL